jgi:hypothetical protein
MRRSSSGKSRRIGDIAAGMVTRRRPLSRAGAGLAASVVPGPCDTSC